MNGQSKRVGILLLVLVIVVFAVLLGVVGQRARAAEQKVQELTRQETAASDIVILYTGNIQGAVEDHIRFSGLAAYKKGMEAKTAYVSLVDCGDALQGSMQVLVSEGADIVALMNQAGYDLAVFGDHDFDYGAQVLGERIAQADAQYLACNAAYTGSGSNAVEQVKPYEIVAYGDTKVAFVGVANPRTMTAITPEHFMEGDKYVYDFALDEKGETLYTCVQGYVNECRSAGADYVVLLTHLGVSDADSPFSVQELVRTTEGVDVVLDGHGTEQISGMMVADSQGKQVLVSAAGSGLSGIGQLVITESGMLTTSVNTDYAQKDAEMEAQMAAVKKQYEAALQETIGEATIPLMVEGTDGSSVQNREMNLGDVTADAYRTVLGAEIGLVLADELGSGLEAGQITYEALQRCLPGESQICMVEASGQEILDCLELAYRAVGADAATGRTPGFLQVSGLQIEVDTQIPSLVQMGEAGTLSIGDGQRRVVSVACLAADGSYQPLDPNGTYRVAASEGLLRDGAYGMTMFADDRFVIRGGMSEKQVWISYLTEDLQGKIDGSYQTAQGRIQIR